MHESANCNGFQLGEISTYSLTDGLSISRIVERGWIHSHESLGYFHARRSVAVHRGQQPPIRTGNYPEADDTDAAVESTERDGQSVDPTRREIGIFRSAGITLAVSDQSACWRFAATALLCIGEAVPELVRRERCDRGIPEYPARQARSQYDRLHQEIHDGAVSHQKARLRAGQ